MAVVCMHITPPELAGPGERALGVLFSVPQGLAPQRSDSATANLSQAGELDQVPGALWCDQCAAYWGLHG